MLNIIKEIKKLCLHQDSKLSKHLIDIQQILTYQHSKIISAEQIKIALQKQIKSDIKYQCLCQQIQVIKLQKKHAVLTKTLHDYHSTMNLNYIIVQLKKEKLFSKILASVKHIIVDHN